VVERSSFQPTDLTDPNKFYPCEPDSGTTSYLYSGWATGDSWTNYTGPVEPMNINGVLALPPEIGLVAALSLGAMSDAMNGAGGNLSRIDSDLSVDVPGIGTVRILRLKDGIERFFITDINNPAGSAKAQSTLYVMADWVSADLGQEFNHQPGGSNVLFMDGHVEFIKYPTKWPVSRLMAALQAKS
jgi:prepilin-type processing-associated H-X9-DG protein